LRYGSGLPSPAPRVFNVAGVAAEEERWQLVRPAGGARARL